MTIGALENFSTSPRMKKARMLKSKLKALLIIFFDINGILMTEWVSEDQTVKPGTHDASKHTSCLADDDARTNSNICTCKWRLCYLTSIEHASRLAYARKLKNFNFLGAGDARWENSQRLYTMAKVLRMFYQRCECFISVASVLSALPVFYQCCECFIE